MASKRRKPAANREPERAAPAAPVSAPAAPAAPDNVAAFPAIPAQIEPFLTRLGEGDARVGAVLAATLAVTALIYVRCLGNAFVFDDDDMIVINRYLGNWSFVWKSLVNDSWWFRDPLHLPQSAYYRPLQDIWLWLNFHLFGLAPAGWHAAMVAMHLLVVWLVFRIGSQLAANRWTGVLAAVLFALMPIHAEPVVWASAIPLPLAAAFELGAFEFYLRWVPSPASFAGEGSRERDRGAAGVGAKFFSPGTGRAGEGAGNLGALALSLGLFGGALLSHESAVVFPVLVAIHAYLIGSDRTYTSYRSYGAGGPIENRAADAVAAIRPYAYEAAAYFIIRLSVLGVISAPNSGNHMTALEVALTIPGAIVSYAILLVAPWLAGPAYRLDIVHSVITPYKDLGAILSPNIVNRLDIVRTIAAPGFDLPILEIAAIVGAGVVLLRRNPRRRLYLFCAWWMLIAIAPMLNLTGLFPDSLIQNRYLYLASFGFCLMAADLAVSWASKGAAPAIAVWIGAAAIAAVYGAALFYVQGFWRDEVALFSRCAEVIPESGFFHNRLGMALQGRGEIKRARAELEAAAKLDPSDGWNLYDLALVYIDLGDKRKAEDAMAAGLARFKDPPAGAYTELAIVADAAGDTQGRDAALTRAAALPGGAELAELTRAQIRFAHGGKADAERMLRELLKRDPDNPDLLSTLGAVLASEVRYEAALAEFQRAAAIAPNLRSLRYQIALTLHKLHRDREAYDECIGALEANPNDPDAQSLMAELQPTPALSPR